MYKPIRQGQRYAALIIAVILAVCPIGGKTEAAEAGARKLDGIREIYAASGFWGGSSFAVGKDGSVWVWGSNIAGQFGSGQSGAYGWTNAPHQIPGLAGVQKLAIGSSGFYFALLKDGSVMAWGGPDSAKPTTLPELKNIADITSGLALGKDGTVYRLEAAQEDKTADGKTTDEKTADGKTTDGKTTDGKTANGKTPRLPVITKQTGIDGVSRIMTGTMVHAALRKDGTLWLWSTGLAGDAGSLYSRQPARVDGLTDVTSVSVGVESVIAVTNKGTVWASVGDWTGTKPIVMKPMSRLSSIMSAETGNGINLVKNTKGEYWFWDDGTELRSLQKFTAVPGIDRLTLKFDGLTAIGKDGSVRIIKNRYLGDKLELTTPVRIKGVEFPVSFAEGENSNYAVLKDGTAMAWGTNIFGQLGTGNINRSSAVPEPLLKPVGLKVNGQPVLMEQPAMYNGGRVYLPLRSAAEALGYTVKWNYGKTELTGHGKKYIIGGQGILRDDGKVILMDGAPVQISDKLLVPGGSLAKALGLRAVWNAAAYELTLQP
ncbi:stalk domain-containing protein [Paenibacillus sp. CN-4]|uniref:stalk domain-containing protein n=1 Tax=Paenibacillus nanchangensis TaxID=3348343 RepID=UPI0039795395